MMMKTTTAAIAMEDTAIPATATTAATIAPATVADTDEEKKETSVLLWRTMKMMGRKGQEEDDE